MMTTTTSSLGNQNRLLLLLGTSMLMATSHDVTPILSGKICRSSHLNSNHHDGCFPCRIPSTVVACLVDNGVFLNDTDNGGHTTGTSRPVFEDSIEKIYYKDNLSKIPDINETGRDFYTYDWYLELSQRHLLERRNSFSHHFLQLRGISYRSTAYYRYGSDEKNVSINDGGILQITNRTDGMWRRHTIDVTPYIQNGTFHRIFLTVEPPLHPGMVSNACPKTPPNPPHSPPTDPPCGQGGDHQMAQDAGAMQFAAGWDWVQGIPDRVTGLFDKVQLLHTQAVRVQDSYLRTLDAVVFLPESNHISESFTNNEKIDQERIDATVLISTTLINNLESTVEGHVCLEIIDEDDSNKQNSHGTRIILQRRHSITLNAKETRTQTWPNVTLPHVQLWWPHTLGKPKLYKVKAYFTIEVSNHVVISDLDEWEAGIRIVSTSIDKKTGGRLFFVNRQRIFLQGGNWIATDAMLQRGSSDRYYDEVLLHRWAGLNFIRVWGGGLTERPEFYRACDRLGILVLQEFWMTGDNNGRWAGDYDWPNDHDIFLAQAEDMIRMIRRHASLMFYCAGNELWPSSKSPPPKIQHGLRQLILDVDRDRFLILSSMDGGFKGGNMSLHDDGYALTVKDGPYDLLTPITYYAEPNPGMVNGTTAIVAFQAEIGSSAMPRLHTIQRMGLGDDATDFPIASSHYVPNLWNFHKFQDYMVRDVANNNTLIDGIEAYGSPHNVEDYVARAQLICWQQYQSLFEGFTSKMFEDKNLGGKSAIIMWKTQSPWPSLRGFLYDWWLGSTGSLDGVRIGTGGYRGSNTETGSNLKIQLNIATMRVELINRGRWSHPKKSSARIEWFKLDGQQVKSQNDIQFGPLKAMSVSRSKVIEMPNYHFGHVLFVQVSLSTSYENAFENNENFTISSWYWMSFNKTGCFKYDYSELGHWRDNGPYPQVTGRIESFAMDSTKKLWWKATVQIHVDQNSKAIAFAPQFSAYDTQGNMLLPLLSESPAVFLPRSHDTVILHGKLVSNDYCVSKVTIDFWAGDHLEIPLIDFALCSSTLTLMED